MTQSQQNLTKSYLSGSCTCHVNDNNICHKVIANPGQLNNKEFKAGGVVQNDDFTIKCENEANRI